MAFSPWQTAAIKALKSTDLDHEMHGEPEEESPEVLAAIERGIQSLEAGERTRTLEEARQRVKEVVAKARR